MIPEKIFTAANKILNSTDDLNSLFRVTTNELRQTLGCDRVAIYRFHPDWSGEFVADSVTSGWISLVEEQRHTPEIIENINECSIKALARQGGVVGEKKSRSYLADTHLQQTGGGAFSQGQIYTVVNDIYERGFSDCYINVLERYQAKAYIIVAIYQESQLWGLLAAFQNSAPREWQESEVTMLVQMGTLFGVALQKSQYIEQIKAQSEQLLKRSDREKALAKILDRIRQSQDLNAIFNVTSSEIRQLLSCDRVAIYRFKSDRAGEFIAESAGSKWVSLLEEQRNVREVVANMAGPKTDNSNGDLTYLQPTQEGIGGYQFYRVVNDIYNCGFSQEYINILEKYQAKAYVSVAIYKEDKLWGLLSAYQNSTPREWLEEESQLLVRIANQFSLAVQQSEYLQQLGARNQQLLMRSQQDKGLAKIVNRIIYTQDLDAVFKIATGEIRQLLKCDRVAIYRFHPDWSGEFIADSASSEWVSLLEEQKKNPEIVENVNKCSVKELAGDRGLLGATSTDSYIQQTQGGSFNRERVFRVTNDIYESGFADCYIKVLESYQARAYIIVAIYFQDKLWGLLAAFQNSGPRAWQEDEINLLVKLANQFGVAMQQADYLEQIQNRNLELAEQAERERTLAKIIERIRQPLDLNELFQTTVKELRPFLKADRVGVFKFYPDSNHDDGEFVSEDVVGNYSSAMAAKIHDRCFGEGHANLYAQGKFQAVADIYKAGFKQCYIDILSKFEVIANLVVPLVKGGELWGLFCVHQCSGPREWTNEEIQFIEQIASQFGIALQQAEYLQQLKNRNDKLATQADREQALAKIIKRIRQSLNLNDLFEITVREIRRFLQADRVGVFKFYPDSGYDDGEFVSEDVASGYSSAIATKIHDHCFGDQYADKYAQGTIQAVADIYNAGFSDCHIDILSKFEVRANLVVPLVKGGELWGLFCVHQCSGPRKWTDEEIRFIEQIASQFGVALQQSEYIQQLQSRNDQLAARSDRETGIIQLSARLTNRLADLVQTGEEPITLAEMAAAELRRILKADRVGVYQFFQDWSGEFVVESVGSKWSKLVGTPKARVRDSYLRDSNGGRYARKESLRVKDIYKAGYQQCHVAFLEEWGTRAYMVAPIFKGEQLWGLLSIHQNDGPRDWEDSELTILEQVATKIGVAYQLADYLKQIHTAEQQLQVAAEREKTARKKLQEEAIMMLQAIEPSFDGDLTVRAPLSEDEIGTIADGYNTTIQTMRELVSQVKVTASRVSDTSNYSNSSVVQLSTEAKQQVEQLERALAQLRLMVKSTQGVLEDIQKVERATQEANKTVSTGDSLMQQTVDGILDIRETVSQTAKKIKSLGEASQKISKVVSLIENFATQTNLLALNAAIEATRAGEYGKGFAVVADEVRSLAYQSASATTKIEQLVQEIQGETKEVTEAMELGIAQVVRGTELVERTRVSLNEIVSATTEIGTLVRAITQAASDQTKQSKTLTEAMKDVSASARNTSTQAAKISDSFEELYLSSQELEESISQFKVD
ncbi:MAG: GAF domain-containing protein [Prochloraceae cyanobacterium]|nr:GAF domain-containing protein [Prochloraceae cyanobacterium]